MRPKGFTLIETLLVLTIISVILAVVGIQISSGPSRGPQQRFEAFYQQLGFAQQYSHATQTTLALAQHQQSLRWIQLSQNAAGAQQQRIIPDARFNPPPIQPEDSLIAPASRGSQATQAMLEMDGQRWRLLTVLTPTATNEGVLSWRSGDFRAQLDLAKLTILGWSRDAKILP